MEENEASKGGVFRDGIQAPMEQLNRNEANSAVPEDDDYDDLYSDLKVGENFLESFRKNEEEEKAVGASVQAAGGKVKVDKGKKVMSIKWNNRDRSRDLAVRGDEMGDRDLVPAARLESSGDGGVKVGSHCHPSGKMVDLEKNASKDVASQEMIRSPTAATAGVSGNAGNVGNSGNSNMIRQGMVSGNAMRSIGSLGALGAGPSGGGGGGGTIFVSHLHWWTTDAQLEAESSKYGAVKEITCFSEPCNGKSKGCCKVEFYEPIAAVACKEGMDGHVFNKRACVVTFASSTLKILSDALVDQNKQNAERQTAPVNEQAWWGPGNTAGNPGSNNNNATVGYSQGGGDNNRGLGRGNRRRAGSHGMGNRGPVGPMGNRTGVVGRGFLGNAGGGFGQVISAASPLIHPQIMTYQAFDPAFGGPMGRTGGHRGFLGGPTPPFSSILPSFQRAGEVALPGVGRLLNPTYSWGGMSASAMGIMARAGLEGPSMYMLSDPNMGGRAGDEHGYRAGESNYGAQLVSDHQYGEERLSNKEKDRGSERYRSSSSNNRYIDNREPSPDRDIARDKNAGRDHDSHGRRRQGNSDVGGERERDRPRSRDHDHDLEKHRDSEHKHGRPRDQRDRYGERERDRPRSRDHDHDHDHDHDLEKHRDSEHKHGRPRDQRDRYANRRRYKGRSSRTQAKSRISHEDKSQARSNDADNEKTSD